MPVIRAEFKGRDEIIVGKDDNGDSQISAVGCATLIALIRSYQVKFGSKMDLWPIPEGLGHADLLLKEIILKYQNKWQYPCEQSEVCHCRNVSVVEVDESILGGAHTPQDVSRLTGASTACGTCRPDIEKIISYRLQKFS